MKISKNSFDEMPLMVKGIIVFIIALAMQIPAFMVDDLVDERRDASQQANREVCSSYGGRQDIHAPVIKVTDNIINKEGKPETCCSMIESSDVEISGSVETETLHKSIYDIVVYNTDLEFKGSFMVPERYIQQVSRQANILLPISTKGIGEEITLTVDGKEHPFNFNDPSAITADGIIFNVNLDNVCSDRPIGYSFRLKSKGAESLRFTPNASKYRVKLSSSYASPGFSGDFLPDKREITGNGFNAEWCITAINKMYVYEPYFGIDFIVPASQYQQTERTIKYSFLVILLIFAALFLSETLTKTNINIVQYIVTGLSLCMFYLILLSVSEYIPFSISYVIASTLTVCSLGGYFFGFMKRKAAISSTVAVALTYIVVYILLNMETYALLAGTAVLFMILCAIMYFTRKSHLS